MTGAQAHLREEMDLAHRVSQATTGRETVDPDGRFYALLAAATKDSVVTSAQAYELFLELVDQGRYDRDASLLSRSARAFQQVIDTIHLTEWRRERARVG